MTIPGIAAVVVHHNSLDTVCLTVESIIDQGVAPNSVLIVDNSADPGVFSSLRALLPSSTLLIHVSNCGYAAAVNSGIRYLADNFSVPPELILVSTHESVPENGAIACLAEAVSSSDEISAAGPTLLTRNSRNEPRVWSTGGYLTSALRLPRHKSHDDHPASLEAASREPVDRQWLDGAFIVYRFRDLHEHPMPEHYFLYMEEVDLHLSLGLVHE